MAAGDPRASGLDRFIRVTAKIKIATTRLALLRMGQTELDERFSQEARAAWLAEGLDALDALVRVEGLARDLDGIEREMAELMETLHGLLAAEQPS